MVKIRQESAFPPATYRGQPFTPERIKRHVEGTNKAIKAGISIPLLTIHAPFNADDKTTEQFSSVQGRGWITQFFQGPDGALGFEADNVPEDFAKDIQNGTVKLTSPEFRETYKSEKAGVYEGPIVRHMAFTPLPGNPHQSPVDVLAMAEAGVFQFSELDRDDGVMQFFEDSKHHQALKAAGFEWKASSVGRWEHEYEHPDTGEKAELHFSHSNNRDGVLHAEAKTKKKLAKHYKDEQYAEESNEPYLSRVCNNYCDDHSYNAESKVYRVYKTGDDAKHISQFAEAEDAKGEVHRLTKQFAEGGLPGKKKIPEATDSPAITSDPIDVVVPESAPPALASDPLVDNPDAPPQATDKSQLAAIIAGLAQKGIVLPSDWDPAKDLKMSMTNLLTGLNTSIKVEQDAEAKATPADDEDAPPQEVSMPFNELAFQFSEEQLSKLDPKMRAMVEKAENDRIESVKAQQFAEEQAAIAKVELAKTSMTNFVKEKRLPPVLQNKLQEAMGTLQFAEDGIEPAVFTVTQVADMFDAALPKGLRFAEADVREAEDPHNQFREGGSSLGGGAGHVTDQRAEELVAQNPFLRNLPKPGGGRGISQMVKDENARVPNNVMR